MRRLIWLPIAGFLLVAGAAIAAAASMPTAELQSNITQDEASPAPSAAASPSSGDDSSGSYPGDFKHGPFGAGADLLDQVLSDLVKAGTITQAQSDAITKGLQQAVTDKQNQAQQDRQKAMQEWQQIQGFLSDGAITQDEVNKLPEDSPFRQIFNSIAQNGQITLQQLQQLRMFGPGGPGGPGPGGPGRGHGWGHGWGPGGFGLGGFGPGGFGPGGSHPGGNGDQPQASPSTTTSNS